MSAASKSPPNFLLILTDDHGWTSTSTLMDKQNANGEVFFKVNKNLVGRTKTGIIPVEPSDTIQIGADTGEAIGEFEVPNRFRGSISMLSFKYPNGT